MARLDWDAAGVRFFETGVDRGVLYLNGTGYAWPGLISVSESPQGGEAKPFYLDGFKYANVAAAEEFEATLSAFYYPAEFRVCDGMTFYQNGLFATQQPRKKFSLSYRTLVGNDVDGATHGYKIHLVYNALAAPAQRDHKTIGGDVEATSFSWGITTLPPMVYGLKPTSHFVIDSRETDSATLLEVEDVLYGNGGTDPRLPTVSELMAFFDVTVVDGGASFAPQFDTVMDGGTP